ncbi:MAG: DUF2336 domain-containing protein [Alphaproteobacteria bacterium]|nr:DUF2336 domain-containing protein [Alphaproteobacteria bacterium]
MTATKSVRAGFLTRDEVLRLIARRGEELRQALAHNPDADPRVLAFLAEEGSLAAQRAVAANPGATAATNARLARSRDEEVRAELARKIGRLLPGLTQEASEEVRRLTLDTLQCLADDEMPRVRAILAEGIKSLTCVPRKLIRKLARDVECVSAPILEYSPLLSDADLIDIITTVGAHHALLAIAKRRPLTAAVSDLIVAAQDIPAVAALLNNADANIRTKTLEKIAEQAESIGAWQGPLSLRAGLSQRAIRRIAGFAGAALIERLSQRHDLDTRTRAHLRSVLKKRLDSATPAGVRQVMELSRRGRIDDAYVMGLALAGNRAGVVAALSAGAGISAETVERILALGQAKPLTALVWRAGFSMRVAFKIQTCLLHLPAHLVLPARDGVHFPLSEDEMRWHLEYFGI